MKRALLILSVIMCALSAHAQPGNAPEATNDPTEAFTSGRLVVKGEGTAPGDRPLTESLKRMLALRAAKLAALREAVEVLNGVIVFGDTRIMDATDRSDKVRTTVQGLVKGAQVVSETYDPMSGLGTVYLSIPLTGPEGVIGRLLPQIKPSIPPGTLYQSDSSAPGAITYDGLIVDVRGLRFKPALVNRVVTGKGEVVYGPTGVADQILLERGAAGYTDDIEKARVNLAGRGSKNPLVIKAEAVVNSTDVQVSPESARVIFSSDRTNHFLERASVVFVLE